MTATTRIEQLVGFYVLQKEIIWNSLEKETLSLKNLLLALSET